MRVRRLTEIGLRRMQDFLDSLGTDAPQPWPEDVLTGAATSQRIEPAVEVEDRHFGTAFEAARYLFQRMGDKGMRNVDRDKGLWAWLALFYFDQLCPTDKRGRRRPGERARWVPAVGDSRLASRHLLLGPFRAYAAHSDNPERVRALLCGPPNRLLALYRELASRQGLITNKAVVEVAYCLYFDPKRGVLRRAGAQGKPGTPRRFVQVLQQFDLTWDLYSLDAQRLLGLLPEEFDRFKRFAAEGLGWLARSSKETQPSA